jgi:cobalamin biosynthesis Co2+ chelatase CbiK
LCEEPTSCGLDVVEGRTGAGNHVADDLTNADEPTALVVKVGRNCEEAGLGEPVSLVAMVLAHAKDVVQNDDAGDVDGGCGDS